MASLKADGQKYSLRKTKIFPSLRHCLPDYFGIRKCELQLAKHLKGVDLEAEFARRTSANGTTGTAVTTTEEDEVAQEHSQV